MSLNSKHKLHSANERFWKYYADAVNLGPDLTDKLSALTGLPYIQRYKLEPSDEYYSRLRKACPIDICSTGVDLLAGSIKDISADIPDSFQEIWDDADLQGTSMIQFMSTSRKKAATFGHSFILVDATRAITDIVTEADVKSYGIRPYVRLLTPLDVTNWRSDEHGNLIEVVYKVTPETSFSVLAEEPDTTEEYRYWSRAEWRVYQVNNDAAVLADSGPNPIGVVPIVPHYCDKEQPMLGVSVIKHAARYQQTLSNTFSSIQGIEEKQSFAQPVLWTNRQLSEAGLGESVVLKLAPKSEDGGQEDFQYRTPDPAPLELAWSSFFRTLNLAVASMALPGDVFESDSQVPESGVAKSYRWRNTERRLETMSLHEQEALRTVMWLCGLWMGKDFDGNITYPTSFDLSGLEDSIQNLISLQSAGVPQVAVRELQRTALMKALPRLDEATKTEINDALNNAVAVKVPND